MPHFHEHYLIQPIRSNASNGFYFYGMNNAEGRGVPSYALG